MLVDGLPSDAAVWRPDGWTDRDEMLATLVEVTDMWGRVAAQQRSGKRIGKPLQIIRPGAEPSRPKVESDPRVIAAWFRQFAS